MRRVFIAGLVLLSGSLGVAAGDEPAGPLGRKLTKLQKQFAEDEKALKKKLPKLYHDGHVIRELDFQNGVQLHKEYVDTSDAPEGVTL